MRDTLSTHWLSFLIVFGTAFGLSFFSIPTLMRLSHRWGFLQAPGGRRKHTKPMPLLGGVAIVIGFVIAVLIAQFLPVERTDPKEIVRLTGLLVGGLFIVVIGTIDDKFELSPIQNYIAQIVAGAIAVLFLIFIENFNNPFTGSLVGSWPYWFTITISLFWLGLMMNTVNWLDGVDGLAGGVVFIAAFMIFLHATFQLNQVSVGLLPLALCGAILGFLIYNFYPAKIFMGGGAPFLGYTLGCLSIIGGAKMATILLVMGLPLMDLAWQMIRRVSKGQNPMYGDRGHLHFRLVDMGYSPRTIVLGYYFFCAAFGGIALLTTSRLFKFISILIMGLLLLGTFALISLRAAKLRHEL